MKYLLLLIIGCACVPAYSQVHDYAQIHIVKKSIKIRANVIYDFGEGEGRKDSVKVYEGYNLKNIVDALQLMEVKGWELISISDYSGSSVVTITTANFRRKKLLPH